MFHKRRRGSHLFPELGAIEHELKALNARMDVMALNITKLLEQVSRTKGIDESILTFVSGTSAAIKDLSAKLKEAIDANDPAAQALIQQQIDKAADDLQANADGVQAAINANPLPA